jgi:hypothetical protein
MPAVPADARAPPKLVAGIVLPKLEAEPRLVFLRLVASKPGKPWQRMSALTVWSMTARSVWSLLWVPARNLSTVWRFERALAVIMVVSVSSGLERASALSRIRASRRTPHARRPRSSRSSPMSLGCRCLLWAHPRASSVVADAGRVGHGRDLPWHQRIPALLTAVEQAFE